MKRVIRMSGKRVGLAVLEKKDVEQFYRWINDPEVSVYLKNFDNIYTREAEEEWYTKVTTNPDEQVLAITELKSGKHIGNVGIKIDRHNDRGLLGIMIGEKNYWNKGFGSEALTLMLDYCFNVLSLHSVHLTVYAFNKRALHVYEKAGFKMAGTERQSRLLAGKYQDTHLLDILADEWRLAHKSVLKVADQ
jgi:RimJ/RimL family protein N-acetyltransferase